MAELIREAYRKYLAKIDCLPAPLLQDYGLLVRDRLVWLIGEPIVGLICLVTKNEDSLLIENIAVSPSVQDRGYRRTLMEFAEQSAARLRLERVVLYTNEVMVESIAFYSYLGYSIVDRRIENGYRRIFMEKIISTSA
ncbi:MAG: GNAT family N-acetyltransferase [Nitrososphaerota archaeon]|nr:GNAT family N-acetyltransferase [Nitrososphaerota archaeon]